MRYLFILLFLSGAAANATEVTGSGTNSNLAQLLSHAAPNETVEVPANVLITLNAGLAISQSGIILQCDSGAKIVKHGNFDVLTVTGSKVTIDGCYFDGAQSAGRTGRVLDIRGVNGFTLRNSTIANAAAEGVAVANSTQVEIASNVFTGNTQAAIWVFNHNSFVWIHDNNIDTSNERAWHTGISAHSNTPVSNLTDISIIGNTIKGGWSFCLEVGAFGGQTPQRVTISGNSCDQQPSTHNFGGYSFDTVAGLTFVNNAYRNLTATDVSLPGLELVNGTGAFVSSNQIEGANISINKQTQTVIQANTIKRGFTGCGIYLGGTGRAATADYNIVSNNTIDMRSLINTGGTARAIWLQANSAASNFSHNQIVGNTILGDLTTGTSAVQIEHDSGTLSDTMVTGNQFVNWQTCYAVPDTLQSAAGSTKIWNNDESGCNAIGTSVLLGINNGVVSYRGTRATNSVLQ